MNRNSSQIMLKSKGMERDGFSKNARLRQHSPVRSYAIASRCRDRISNSSMITTLSAFQARPLANAAA